MKITDDLMEAITCLPQNKIRPVALTIVELRKSEGRQGVS